MGEPSMTLTIDGAGADFVVHACEIQERLCAAFVCRITCTAWAYGAHVAAETLDLIGLRAKLTLSYDDVERDFPSAVERARDTDGRSIVTVAARIAELDDTCDYRVFVDASATDIATLVLSEHGVDVDLRARRTAPRRAQCVQGFESDLSFCTRILAEEGMCWFLKYSSPEESTGWPTAITRGT